MYPQDVIEQKDAAAEKKAIEQIKSDHADHAVVLYMKGTPALPQCGFSSLVAGILNHMEISYTHVDVLADNAIRHAIKGFSQWPTIPQLYVKGEFIGGCDIIKEMYQTGELRQLFDSHDLSRIKG